MPPGMPLLSRGTSASNPSNWEAEVAEMISTSEILSPETKQGWSWSSGGKVFAQYTQNSGFKPYYHISQTTIVYVSNSSRAIRESKSQTVCITLRPWPQLSHKTRVHLGRAHLLQNEVPT